jgi:hypothetical protein
MSVESHPGDPGSHFGSAVYNQPGISEAAEDTHVCPVCRHAVSDVWIHCAHCGALQIGALHAGSYGTEPPETVYEEAGEAAGAPKYGRTVTR